MNAVFKGQVKSNSMLIDLKIDSLSSGILKCHICLPFEYNKFI